MDFYLVRIFPYMDWVMGFLDFAYCILLFILSTEIQQSEIDFLFNQEYSCDSNENMSF